MDIKIINKTDTINLAKKLSTLLKGGEIIAISGELGAGKTFFSQSLGKHLGVVDNITSPTFVVMKIYKTNHDNVNSLCHIDAYRLKSGDELAAIGALDYIGNQNTVSIIEWAENIKNILPNDTIFIRINSINENERIFTIENCPNFQLEIS